MSTATIDVVEPKVVSRTEWLAARTALLAKEKAHTRQHDELARQRRELPWVKVDKTYTFDTPQGRRTLADLFAGKSQLVVYHFMMGPGWPEGCPGCSFIADSFGGALMHFTQRDAAFTAVARAPLSEIEPFKRRMGWTFPWVSSFGSDFNRDFGVLFTADERAAGLKYNYGSVDNFPSDDAPGLSVFAKGPDGQIYHTYSTYSRGLEPMLGAYTLLDWTPKGRDEDALAQPMAWVRHHDKYQQPAAAPKSACECSSNGGRS
jgi:predicted dithiol-disulfide oxidoreductase (DUF899 family)